MILAAIAHPADSPIATLVVMAVIVLVGMLHRALDR